MVATAEQILAREFPGDVPAWARATDADDLLLADRLMTEYGATFIDAWTQAISTEPEGYKVTGRYTYR
jgi:hypothetical protein